ncbi:MAG: PEP-CTERM sorting domain-containing protein [Planctomycetota bacterium]|nr:MAG: PEP-CTERM sorting domain-containing protein [Planctomycetota bacterium]
MTITTRQLTTIAVLALTMLTANTLRAGQITGFTWFSGVASVAGTSFSPPSAPNNDDVAGTSPNGIFVTQKDYTAIGPVDLVFDVTDTGGTTEYLVTEGVQNNTGLDWGSYHIELGFGEGAGFVKSTSGDGLDFDAPDFNSDFFFDPLPGFFPTVSVTEDDIIASGGVMPDFSFAGYFLFHVDVPDGISSFTIRQSPVEVPEPSTLVLGAMGVSGLLLTLRRRSRSAKVESAA